MKKQKGKGQKAGGSKKKDEPSEAKEDPGQEEEVPAQPEQHTEGEVKDTADEQTLEQPETTSKPSHGRQPSLSLQSQLRSSSFRRTSVSQGALSPNGTKSPEIPVLSPDGGSVNSIYRKQAARLDDLEKENRRLSKDVQEAEKRWRHNEEELEELREASGEVAELKSRAQMAEAHIEEFNKLVCRYSNILDTTGLILFDRSKKIYPSNAKSPNFNLIPLNVTSRPQVNQIHPQARCHPSKPNWTPKVQILNPWKWKYPISAPS